MIRILVNGYLGKMGQSIVNAIEDSDFHETVFLVDINSKANSNTSVDFNSIDKSVVDKIDCIVPVPISKKKLRARTFNQSEEIAKGLKTVVNVPIVTNWLKRKNSLKSQTLSNRYQRSINVKEEYYLNKKKTIENKRLLILDDVVTTGATLQSCLEALDSNKNKSIYVVALAATKKD